MKQIKQTFRELLRYPSAVLGLGIILTLVLVAIYTVIKIPYHEAIRLWRGGEEVWYKNPKYAAPEWTNLFRTKKLAKTFSLNSADGTANKEVSQSGGVTTVNITFTFDYQYDTFPQEMSLYFKSEFDKKQPNVSISWMTPAGKLIQVAGFSIGRTQTYRLSQDTKLARKLAGLNPQEGLFVLDPKAENPAPVRGKYELRVSGLLFEATGNLDAEFVLYGQVAGWAGTDHNRRDLGIALLWGIPIALAFGLLAALGTTVFTMIIAAFGVWFGGWVDELIQRITEVNSVLPFLPILIMIGTFYSRSILTILGGAIALSIFGLSIKTYRSTFLQIKEIGLYRSRPIVWGWQHADHIHVSGPAHDPVDHSSIGDRDSFLCFPGSGSGGAGVGRSDPAHLGQSDQRRPIEWGVVQRAILLGVGALGPADDSWPGFRFPGLFTGPDLQSTAERDVNAWLQQKNSYESII